MSPEGETRSHPTASAYVRLSKEAGKSNLSLDGMMQDLRDLADTLGFRLIAEHADDGISGAVRDRPEFREWLDDARHGRADVLLTFHADRLTREGVNAAALVLDVVEGKDPETGAVVRKPVRLLDVKGLDSEGDPTAFRFQFVIAAEVARAERERIKERNLRTKARMRQTPGRWGGGPRPYGYKDVPAPDGVGKILVVDPEQAAIVQRIADEILAGRSLYSIAVRLNEDGIPTAKPLRTLPDGTVAKRAWTRSTVRNLARSEHVLGRVSVAAKPGARERRALTGPDGVPLVVWPPLLDLDTVERIRAATEATPTPGRSEATIAGRRKRASRLLSGLLSCTCGAHLVVRRRKGVAYYGCSVRASGAGHKGVSILVEAEKVEEAVTKKWLAGVGHLPVVEVVTRVPSVAGLTEAERDLAEATAALNAAADAAELDVLMQRVRNLHARRARLAALPTTPTVEIVETGETFRERWERLDHVDDRRRLIEISKAVIEVLPARRRGFWDADRISVAFHDYEASARDLSEDVL